jgi:hypothetical protein
MLDHATICHLFTSRLTQIASTSHRPRRKTFGDGRQETLVFLTKHQGPSGRCESRHVHTATNFFSLSSILLTYHRIAARTSRSTLLVYRTMSITATPTGHRASSPYECTDGIVVLSTYHVHILSNAGWKSMTSALMRKRNTRIKRLNAFSSTLFLSRAFSSVGRLADYLPRVAKASTNRYPWLSRCPSICSGDLVVRSQITLIQAG